MKGDFSRGYRPDAKRGQRYRRVLLQQGRVLLDSDHAAMVDATDLALRELRDDLTGTGSADQGFRITPGTLHAVFDRPGRISGAAGHFALDYARRFQGLPSLLLIGDADDQVDVDVELEAGFAADDTLRIWYWSDISQTLHLYAVGDLTEAGQLAAVDTVGSFEVGEVLTATGGDVLRFRLEPGQRIWIGMIEGRQAAPNTATQFGVAAGRYAAGSLVAENPQAATWPEQAFPAAAGFNHVLLNPLTALAANSSVFVYLEAWERTLTHLHDPGMRERALGVGVDTTVRTRVVGQVKVATQFDGSPSDITRALAQPQRGNGQITIDPPAAWLTDPNSINSALFSGRENRLYHFEVHVGGDVGVARFKWSSRGGGEVFEVVAATSEIITVARDCPLRDGELVEIVSEVVELGDAADAHFDEDGNFHPATRMAGQLALLQTQGQDGNGNRLFRLREPESPHDPITLDTPRYGATAQHVTMLRRWNGTFLTAGSPAAIEDGIEVTTTGTFEVGAWWQWEVRVAGFNDNGTWQPSAHGPERQFVPLALLQTPSEGTLPLDLIESYGERFLPLDRQTADHLAYDGDLIDGTPRSVQDALDLLYAYRGFGQRLNQRRLVAGELATASLQAAINSLLGGDELVLPPGVYVLDDTLTISGDVVIRGRPGTMLIQTTLDPMFTVSGGKLRLIDLELRTDPDLVVDSPLPLVHASAAVELEFERCALFAKQSNIIGVTTVGGWTPTVDDEYYPAQLDPLNQPAVVARVSMRSCTVMTGSGLRLGDAELALHDCGLRTLGVAVSGQSIVNLRCTGSVISDQLLAADFTTIGPWTVANDWIDLAAARELARSVGAPGAGGGYGLAIEELYGGMIVDSTIIGGSVSAVAFQAAWQLQVSNSTLIGQARSLHSYHLDACRFRHSTLSQALQCRMNVTDVTVESCKLQIVELGINTEVSAITVREVEVRDNQIDATGCIALGSETPPANSVIQGLTVSGNIIPAKDGGVGVSDWAILIGGAMDPAAPRRILVTKNRIERNVAGHGIWIHGGFIVEVADNSIILTGGELTALSLNDSVQVEVSGNSLVYTHNVRDHSLIEIVGCENPRFIGNSAIGEPARLGVSLAVSDNFYMHDNIIPKLDVRITGGENLSIRDNEIGTLESVDAIGARVQGNTVRETFHTVEWYFIEGMIFRNISGTWFVGHNFLPYSALRLIPVADGSDELSFYEATVTCNHADTIQIGYLDATSAGTAAYISTNQFIKSAYAVARTCHPNSRLLFSGNSVYWVWGNADLAKYLISGNAWGMSNLDTSAGYLQVADTNVNW